MNAQATHILCICLAQHVFFVGLARHHVRSSAPQARVHGEIGHKVVLEPEIGIHADEHGIEKPWAISRRAMGGDVNLIDSLLFLGLARPVGG